MILNYRQKHTPWPEEGLEVLKECEWVDKIGKKSILLEMLLKKMPKDRKVWAESRQGSRLGWLDSTGGRMGCGGGVK